MDGHDRRGALRRWLLFFLQGRKPMNRCYPGWIVPIVTSVAFTVGCGSSADSTASKAAKPSPADAVAADAPADIAPGAEPPTEIVSRFLDSVRRGGAQAEAGRLMTEKAQAECRRTGLVVQPIGSPDAQFEVTRGEQVPGEQDAALVHSLWTEPDGAGNRVTYQVVWALRRESVGWRISGLAMELQEGAEPLVVDFESGASLAAMMGEGDSGAGVEDAKPATADARQATTGGGAALEL